LGFGSFKRSWIPSKICLMVMAGFHPSSSFKMDRHTVPEGYTFGWKRGGVNLPAKEEKNKELKVRQQGEKKKKKQSDELNYI